ncbi:MAG: chitobiase/beta-hexosaminidase C-terminal domain-containing protein [Planctomycetota bacterium]|nr:chitobiase/beta-hexosaminidase C-terminal domain-containing protein [Planctomycetota bacterium]
MTFHAVQDVEYQIAVDGYGGTSGGVLFNLAAAVPPPNDDFAARIPLSGVDVSTTATNVDAGREAGEPEHAKKTGGASLWWSWQAPGSGSVTISTAGSDFDTLLGVYTGGSIGALSGVAANDNYGGQKTSRVGFGVAAGTTYQIAVDGYRGATGNVSLAVHFAPKLGAPVFSPAGGDYTNVQFVTISCGTDGATIYYTSDGSTPSSSSAPYSEPVRVATSLTLKAFAAKAGAPDSDVASAAYSLPPMVATPSFSPAAGGFSSEVSVTISCATDGATIYCTTDGSTPTSSLPQYAGPIRVTASATLKAFAAKAGMVDSEVAGADYIIGPAPVIASGPTVVTGVAVAGQPVQFFCAAEDPGVTWRWDFGDGTTAATSNGVATHTYGAAGAYPVTLTVTGSNGVSTTRTVTVDVKAAGSVSDTLVDTDGDGFPNEMETALDTSPTDAASTPFGAPAGTPQPLKIAKMTIKLNFLRDGSDTIAVSGTLRVPDGFQVAGQSALVDVGGVIEEFPLDTKGASPKGRPDSFKLAVRTRNKVTVAQDARFTAKFAKGAFAALLADEGLHDADAKGELLSVPVIILVGGNLFMAEQPQLYTATGGKSGKTSVPR